MSSSKYQSTLRIFPYRSVGLLTRETNKNMVKIKFPESQRLSIFLLLGINGDFFPNIKPIHPKFIITRTTEILTIQKDKTQKNRNE
jgi:hypothetical protein